MCLAISCLIPLGGSEFGFSMFEGAIVSAEQADPEEVAKLPSDEQMVYRGLGPTYQKIYLHALTSEMRHRVVVYVKRGLTPFEAINVILRAEQRRCESGKTKKTISPSERATMRPRPAPDITG